MSGAPKLPEDSVSLTSDSSTNEARLWLLSGGISLSLAASYGIVYSPKYRRVFVPITSSTTGSLSGWIARSIYGDRPKYIIKTDPSIQSSVVFRSDDRLLLPGRDTLRYDVVVTEDALSAIRVGRLVPARAILGTTARDKELEIFSGLDPSGLRIGVWLDGDKAGRKGRENVVRKLSLMGADVERINTPRDPKKYSNREIRRILSAGPSSASSHEAPEGFQ